MPDVGILNLQIHDNSEQAVQGLDRFKDALSRIRDVVKEVNIGTVATQIRRVAKVVDESLNETVIGRITEFCDAMSKLKGLGDIKINLRAAGQISKTLESIETGKDTMSEMGSVSQTVEDAYSGSFSAMESSVEETTKAVEGLHRQMDSLSDADRGIDYSKLDLGSYLLDPVTELKGRLGTAGSAFDAFKNQIHASIPVFRDYRDTVMGLESKRDIAGFKRMDGEQLLASVREAGSRTKEIVEEAVQGSETVATETIENITQGTEAVIEQTVNEEEEYAKEFERICERMKEKSEACMAVQAIQDAKFREDHTKSISQTDAIADNLTQEDLLIAQINEASIKYNQFYNTLGAGNSKTIKAGLHLQKLKDDLWKYRNELETAREVEENANIGDPAKYLNSSNVELMTMKYNEMSRAYEDNVKSGKLNEQQKIEEAMKLNRVREQLEDLKAKEEEATEETHRFRDALENLNKRISGGRLSKLLSQFARIAKYRFLRSIIKQISDGFREGLENVYRYSQAVGTSFAPAMDSATSSLLMMKNSIGAAVAPLLQSLVPYLQQIVGWFINLVNYANQFFALMNGQKTWTRALMTEAKAYDDIKKNASGASKAAKDLLADWDELNIIQSENSGSGSGNSGKVIPDYSAMFEEVSVFNEDVQNIAGFIKDNFGDILGLVEAIGVAILGWKLASSFLDGLSALKGLAGGLIEIAVGLVLSYDAGHKIAMNGATAGTIIESIAGVVAATLGGFSIGGAAGAAVGLGVSVAVWLTGYIQGSEEKETALKWGNKSMTPEEIHQYVIDQFTFDVEAKIKVYEVNIENMRAARSHVEGAIADFQRSINVAKLEVGMDCKVNDANIKTVHENALKVIASVNELIEKDSEAKVIAHMGIADLFDMSSIAGTDMLDSVPVAGTTLKQYLYDSGKRMADAMMEGERAGWDEGVTQNALALFETQERVFREADLNAKKYKRDSRIDATMTDVWKDGVFNMDAAKAAKAEQENILDEYRKDAEEFYKEKIDNAFYLAGLAKAAEDEATRRGSFEEAKGLHTEKIGYLAEAYILQKTKNDIIEKELADTKKNMAASWGEILKLVYGEDFDMNSGYLIDFNTAEWMEGFAYRIPGSITKNKISKMIEESGIEEAGNMLYSTFIEGVENADSTGIAKWAIEDLELNAFELLSDGAREDIMSQLIDLTGDAKTAARLFASMFDLELSEAMKYIPTQTINIPVEFAPIFSASASSLRDSVISFRDMMGSFGGKLESFGSASMQDILWELNKANENNIPEYNYEPFVPFPATNTNDEDYDIWDALEGKRMVNPARMMASAGYASGVNFVPASTMGANETVETEDKAMVDAQNRQIAQITNVLVPLLQQILQKPLTVNLAPSSNWGQFNDRSYDRFSKVNGNP